MELHELLVTRVCYCSSNLVLLSKCPNLTLIWLCFPLGWADQKWWPLLCPERPRGRTDSSGYLREVVCSVRARDELFLSSEWVSRAPGTCTQTKPTNTSTRPWLKCAIQRKDKSWHNVIWWTRGCGCQGDAFQELSTRSETIQVIWTRTGQFFSFSIQTYPADQ